MPTFREITDSSELNKTRDCVDIIVDEELSMKNFNDFKKEKYAIVFTNSGWSAYVACLKKRRLDCVGGRDHFVPKSRLEELFEYAKTNKYSFYIVDEIGWESSFKPWIEFAPKNDVGKYRSIGHWYRNGEVVGYLRNLYLHEGISPVLRLSECFFTNNNFSNYRQECAEHIPKYEL